MQDIEPNGSLDVANDAGLPFLVRGTVNEISDVVDMFRFTAPRDGELVAHLSNFGVYDLDLYLGDLQAILAQSNSETASEETIRYLVERGQTYFVWVYAWNTAQQTVAYELSVVLSGEDYVESPSSPTSPASYMTWAIADGCNDGLGIRYKIFDVDNNLVWPSSSTHYWTEYYDWEYEHNLACFAGAKVCFGGRTGETYWGVDIDASKSCTACCYVCTQGGRVNSRLVC